MVADGFDCHSYCQQFLGSSTVQRFDIGDARTSLSKSARLIKRNRADGPQCFERRATLN